MIELLTCPSLITPEYGILMWIKYSPESLPPNYQLNLPATHKTKLHKSISPYPEEPQRPLSCYRKMSL
jgi:hypothetical protein